MPYKDPKKQREAERRWQEKNGKAYREKMRERIRKSHREWYLKNRDEKLAKITEHNRKKLGFAEREVKDGPKAQRAVRVPMVRRWVFIEGKVYFNKETGYSLEEIAKIFRMFMLQNGLNYEEAMKALKKARAELPKPE